MVLLKQIFTTFFNILIFQREVFNILQSIDENILRKDASISKALLLCDHSLNDVKNTSILITSIEYIISTKCFDAPLRQYLHSSICLFVVYF